MTSAVSREDIENELWRLAGRVAPWQIERVMRLIDRYAISQGRKYGGNEFELPPVKLGDIYPNLKPGQQDAARKVARCVECERVKKLANNFNLDKSLKPGFQRICRTCVKRVRAAEPPVTNPGLSLICVKCGVEKEADGNFYRRSKSETGYDAACKDCTEYRKACLICCQRRHMAEYEAHPDRRPICDQCRDNRKEETAVFLRTYFCRSCKIDKWVEDFPPGKRIDAHSSFFCSDCTEEKKKAA